jgi:hypothetical protein
MLVAANTREKSINASGGNFADFPAKTTKNLNNYQIHK